MEEMTMQIGRTMLQAGTAAAKTVGGLLEQRE